MLDLTQQFSMPEPPVSPPPAPKRKTTPRRWLLLLLLVALAAGAQAAYIATRPRPVHAAPGTPDVGTVTIESSPAGLEVAIDGTTRGRTPATLTLIPGGHLLQLTHSSVKRTRQVHVRPGAHTVLYFELPQSDSSTGMLLVNEPAGARILVDGLERGTAPATLTLDTGRHDIVLVNDRGAVQHSVSIEPGGTTSLVASMPTAAGPTVGWLSVNAPYEMQVVEQGKTIGSTNGERIMLLAGAHEVEIVSEPFGYRATRNVQVNSGRTATLDIELPKGVVHLNATPWAEVFVDGQRVGETPIGNLAVPIGPHEISFRHPQLGEKRVAAVVKLSTPTRLSMDLRK
jgi:hypothetical protein